MGTLFYPAKRGRVKRYAYLDEDISVTNFK
jgi:hypothetical protein